MFNFNSIKVQLEQSEQQHFVNRFQNFNSIKVQLEHNNISCKTIV